MVGVGDVAQYFRPAPEVRGLYLVKTAVSVTACYLAIQLLIAFDEVLLPFIFAVLCVIILEPLKRFISRILQHLTVILLQRLNLEFLLEPKAYSHVAGRASDYSNEADMMSPTPYDDGYVAPRLQEESGDPQEDTDSNSRPMAAVPVPAVKRMILVVSIVVCLMTMARVLWITAKVFLRAGYAISADVQYYRAGADRLKLWIKHDIKDLHIEGLDWGKVLDELVSYVEEIGKVVTTNVLNTALQAVVTLIFLLYMLWSPVKMESDTVTQEVFRSTGRYLKVKTAISAITGLLVFILLMACGLDLPAAFGLLAFIANFLPGIGSFVASVLPCILAVIDVRKTPTQVLVALVLQLVVHFLIDFFVEPVFFGISVEIHSVIVILGIWFFYQVWGVPGMLLSVPLLAVIRLLLKSMKHANRAGSIEGEDADTVVFLDSILQGRWMSSVGETGLGGELEEMELHDFASPTKAQSAAERVNSGLSGSGAVPGSLEEEEDEARWRAVSDNALCSGCLSFYKEHRLLMDVGLLLAGFLFLLWIPTLE
eukprot:TRINITY_DN15444_c0_g1_i2.p1 TRINITY_DN15444_c0_g1~~TRINITY_DN15444_c0_g1_i2.p1  ORF type:complete len:539 (+),score=107.65 TRINITY_DN15444_c0_g1_i2:155-1771(+)